MLKRICILLFIAALLVTGCSNEIQNQSQFPSAKKDWEDSLKYFLSNGEMYFSSTLHDGSTAQEPHIQKEAAAYLLQGSFLQLVDRIRLEESFYMGEMFAWPEISLKYAEMTEPGDQWSAVRGWAFVFLTEEKQEALGYKSDSSRLLLTNYSEYEVREGTPPSRDTREHYSLYWLYLLPVDAYDRLMVLMEG